MCGESVKIEKRQARPHGAASPYGETPPWRLAATAIRRCRRGGSRCTSFIGDTSLGTGTRATPQGPVSCDSALAPPFQTTLPGNPRYIVFLLERIKRTSHGRFAEMRHFAYCRSRRVAASGFAIVAECQRRQYRLLGRGRVVDLAGTDPKKPLFFSAFAGSVPAKLKPHP